MTTTTQEQFLDLLDGFTLTTGSDEVKIDLEMRCDSCGRHIADAEHGDSIGVLVRCCLGHRSVCSGQAEADEEEDAS